ncbi:hypothetical protein N7468_004685 [Penicillium chermesinum]|uniref:Uncharacterized protein n=1 Tax=Penicillium chermesinum TaxID=63820 RepID=A0A9W9TST4_9EURO|nr:uncharacterized protein N7468_004685 [Penicillium chermesinum]KAJ5240066.1 hypothetical protein N7468_004685 [Penicillium chermesinum]
MGPASSHAAQRAAQVEPAVGVPADSLNNIPDSQPANAASSAVSSADEYRPLTTILDPHIGFSMGNTSGVMDSDFFHNQYQGMGDWLLRDLDWNTDVPW